MAGTKGDFRPSDYDLSSLSWNMIFEQAGIDPNETIAQKYVKNVLL